MKPNPSLTSNPVPAKWLSFSGARVELRTGKVEIGQGIGIALKQIAADELCVPVDCVDLVAGDTHLTPDELWTSASISVEIGGGAVRTIAADVRERFRVAAARRLNTSPDAVVIRNGVFETDGVGGVSYGDLVADVDLTVPVDTSIAPLPPVHHRAVGQPVPRDDLPAKLNGAGFIHDIALDGMLHARVILPPRPGCTLENCDEAFLRALPGVRDVVRDGSFLAITSEREEWAIRAAEKAEDLVSWQGPKLPLFSPVADLLDRYDASPEPVLTEGGSDGGDVVLRLTRPFLAHASVGLVCALAEFKDERLTVWSQSQGVFPLGVAIARTLDLSAHAVRVIHAPGAGCYGHNGADDVALEAALIARAVQRPVRLVWTRAQEIQAAPAGPAMQVTLTAGTDTNGRIDRWSHKINGFTHLTRPGWGDGVNLASAWAVASPQEPSQTADPGQVPFGGAGCRNAPPIYDVPAQVDYALIKERSFRTSALRALGAHLNVFAIESMMDELAERTGADPLAYRLDHLTDPRAIAVLKRVADMAGWPPAPSDGTTGRGLGFARYKNSAAYCAVICDLALDERVTVTSAWAAVDAGQVINPDGVRNQIEGGILQSISWTLHEELRWTESGFDAPDWEAYPVLGFDEIPSLEVDLMDAQDAPPLGVGECATGPTAAALGNAIKQALGVRIVDMPLTPDKIAQAFV
ncbi:xanthine dehydrogenase family protein molybdopterin-binding subunit [Marivita hallyeonensis]|uniref:CO or xanthine dehydrogenase, Mo-binding subunit n=1 Tax=Marivita hallyeonensis TaxID=996342 RepID=A0A1M5SDG0_9RHOB|nr:molybdopterin cofactor-binding domain-containing protein [Marivita hallyeonensis]SHH35963.1 CO or xanthine dehydrogenase, Mo-binding subunit [Marivita hallyeonensis]